MKAVELGTIGSGVIVHTVLDNVKRVEGIHLAAVYSRSEASGRALSEEYGNVPVFTDLNAFLADERVNTVYIASPNSLHFEQTKRALTAGKNVICEKPFCLRESDARELADLAEKKHLMLIEAVPTAFLPNYNHLKNVLPEIGRVRLVQGNYSQYSSRYDNLRAGEMPNIFNPEFGGGCLMDINFYNVYLNVALFGRPQDAVYYPNLFAEKTDTSGIAVMQYEDFVSESAGAKDTWGVNAFQIEGEKGYIYIPGGSNGLSEIQLVTKAGTQVYNDQPDPDRWFYEVQALSRLLRDEDFEAVQQRLSITLDVVATMERMRKKAGLMFPGD